MSETFICSRCSEEFSLEDCTFFDGEALCPECLDEHTCICSRCGDRIWQDNSVCDEHLILCQHCADTYYDHCAVCGRLVDLDELHYLDENDCTGYCEACFHERTRGNGVRSYCYKPLPIFYGDGPRYFGVELEIDNGGEPDQNANLIEMAANVEHDRIYIKHDGSLHNGLEIVTHPMSLDYHRHGMPWKAIIQKALYLGYASHKPGTCGLHIHVNRDSLGYDCQQQENTIARVLFLVETFWNELLRFSRRTQA